MKNVFLILWAIALPVMGQSTNITGIPPEANVFSITFKPNKSPVEGNVIYGAIKVRGTFLEGDYPEDDSDLPTNIVIVSDAPDAPDEYTVLRSELEGRPQPETSAHRSSRYDNAGYVEVEGRNGEAMLIPKSAKRRAETLETLQSARDQAKQERVAAQARVASVEVAAESRVGLLAQWGPHAGIVAGALVLIFGIARFCFLDE